MSSKDCPIILETIEIFSDKEAAERLRHSIKEVKEEKQITSQLAKNRLNK